MSVYMLRPNWEQLRKMMQSCVLRQQSNSRPLQCRCTALPLSYEFSYDITVKYIFTDFSLALSTSTLYLIGRAVHQHRTERGFDS